ncbi:hypothetical protein P692DRAFT_201842220 [Suillus brevipes Sb2]|nr:hypothetical protein P692DRAFT_201842220 [Suillus brevipes Sb2]
MQTSRLHAVMDSDLFLNLSLAHFRIRHALDHDWADSTLSKYRSVVSKHVPSLVRCPASDQLLCTFAASHVGLISGDTVYNHLSALQAWHAYNNKPWLGGVRLNYIINGISNLALSSSVRPSCPPVTHTMLPNCLGKLPSPWEKSFDTSHIVCGKHIFPPFNNNGSCIIHLPFTTVKKMRGEDVVICHQCDASDPITSIELNLSLNQILPNLPFFSFHSPQDIRCLTKRKFLARCNEIWSAAGIPTASGHSFRIVGTTELLLAGVPPSVVQSLSCWSSDAFLRYWRSLKLIAPLHVENLPPSF